jgi:nucleoside-diphosphate-sugar epimerase
MAELTGLTATTQLEEGIARTYAWYRAEVLEEVPA